MKQVIALCLAFNGLNLNAQKILNNVSITSTVETHTEMNGNRSAVNTIHFQVFIKDSLSKVTQDLASMKIIKFLDRATGISTVLTDNGAEMKTGFRMTVADQLLEKKSRDSISKVLAGENAQAGRSSFGSGGHLTKNIVYLNEQKSINNISCKKAEVTKEDMAGVKTVFMVWYTDEYILPEAFLETNMMLGFAGLKGLPVYYESVKTMSMYDQEIAMIGVYQITELKTDAIIAPAEFEIPTGFKIKSFKEWIRDNPSGIIGR